MRSFVLLLCFVALATALKPKLGAKLGKKPPASTCGKNEVLVQCAKSSPPDATCQSYFDGKMPVCPPESDEPCMPACRCAEGFVRVGDKCTTPDDCCPDPYAEMVPCPIPCPGGTCQDYKYEVCKIKCKPYGCMCKRGYLKRSNTDLSCVSFKTCMHDNRANMTIKGDGSSSFSMSFSYSYSYSYSESCSGETVAI